MARLLIGCELGTQSTAEKARAALDSWGAVPVLGSLWVLNTPLDAGYVRSALQDIVEPQDSIAIIDLHPGSEWSATGVSEDATGWLSEHLGEHP